MLRGGTSPRSLRLPASLPVGQLHLSLPRTPAAALFWLACILAVRFITGSKLPKFADADPSVL